MKQCNWLGIAGGLLAAWLVTPAYAAVTGEWQVNLQRSGRNVSPASTGATQEEAWAHCLARIPRSTATSTQYRCQTPRYVATVTSDPAPTPVNCVVSDWSAWTGGTWGVCSNGTQTRQETRTRTVVTQPANGGAACPALTETRTASQACTVEPPPPPSAGLLLDMLYDGSADAGWGSGNAYAVDTRNWTRQFLPTGGPQGQPAWQMAVLYGTSTGGQFKYGWRRSLGGGITWGSEIYYRVRFRFTPETNFRCRDWSDYSGGGTAGAGCIDKLVILNDGCSSRPCRFIHSVESTSTGYRHRIQIDGGSYAVDTPSYRQGTWQDIQVRVRYSSASGRSDGGYAIWVDSDDPQRPTAQMTTALNAVDGADYFCFGCFQNHGTNTGGVYQWQHADFEVGRSFAPWDR